MEQSTNSDYNVNDVFKLAAFDFDHTIIDVNSDTYIDKLLTKRQAATEGLSKCHSRYTYAPHIEELAMTHSWTARMNAAFELMHAHHGVTRDELLGCLREIVIADEMKTFMRALKDANFDIIIISDSNSVFIDEILRANQLSDIFTTDKIFTNPATFDEHERLHVQPCNELHNTQGNSFICGAGICATNICKGSILNDYVTRATINRPVTPRRLIYVGDGRNDFCPGLTLNPGDIFFVRENFSLAKLLKNETNASRVKATVKYWSNATQMHDTLREK